MIIDRRAVLAAIPTLAVSHAFAKEAPAAFRRYEHDSGGRVGLYAENLSTGARLTWRANERFLMCSTFKAQLAAFVLSRVDRGESHLEQTIAFGERDLLDYAPVARRHLAWGEMTIAEMCEGSVELSDNTCANLLLAHVGGPAGLTAFWRSIDDDVSRLDHNEPELNRSVPGHHHDTTTPAAMAGNIRRLVIGDALSKASRERLSNWMRNCKTGAKRLRAGLPADWEIGDKTGSNARDASGDVAFAFPKPGTAIVMCVYTQGGFPTAPQLDALYADAGRMVAEQLG